MRFHITDGVRSLGVHGAFVVLSGVDNTRYAPELEAYREEATARLRATLAPDAIETDPVLKGFRDLHDAVGRSNRRFPASAEALVALFLRRGIVPRVNPIVDVYNLVSLETRLSLGAHDVSRLDGGVTLRIADGSERFVPLGATAPDAINAGEYVYVDDSNEVLCRLEHRQCEKTKVSPATTDCFYIIQGNAATNEDAVRTALARLVALTRRFCGGAEAQAWLA